MPLLDYFHPPFNKRPHWESFHSTWATLIARQLNLGQLPEQYLAEPQVNIGIQVESDVGTFEDEEEVPRGAAANGGVSTAVWTPPKPPIALPIDFADLDVFEVKVYDEENARTLVAAVELVSPANKDRPSHRREFLTKCAAYLQQHVAVIVVDVVSSRRGNFHRELMELLQLGEAAAAMVTDPLYAVAYRTLGKGNRQRIEAWPAPVALGEPLPTLPLWLASDLAVPLDLESGYLAACESFRLTNRV
jgi:Protein of unknown function (DUF4058)